MAQHCVLNMKPQIFSLTKEDKLAKPIILIAGLILSLWSYCIFYVGCFPRGVYDSGLMIVIIGFATHIIISIAATKGVLHGLKHNDPVFLKPWIFTKIVEGIFLFIGSILCSTASWGTYIAMTPIGIIFLMIGLYITLCVWSTYKKMIPENAPETSDHLITEQPPAYDSFTNQKPIA